MYGMDFQENTHWQSNKPTRHEKQREKKILIRKRTVPNLRTKCPKSVL